MLSETVIEYFKLGVGFAAWAALMLAIVKKDNVILWNAGMVAAYALSYGVTRAIYRPETPELRQAIYIVNLILSLLHVPIIMWIVIRATRFAHIVVAAWVAVQFAYYCLSFSDGNRLAGNVLIKSCALVSIAVMISLLIRAPWRAWVVRAYGYVMCRLDSSRPSHPRTYPTSARTGP